jgi:hypothetical protein
MNSSDSKPIRSAKQQVAHDIRRAIEVLDMLKTSHKKAELQHFEMVIEDLQSSIKEIEMDSQ